MALLFGGHDLSPLVEIVLNDLPNSGGAMAPQVRTPRKNMCIIFEIMLTRNYIRNQAKSVA